MNRDDSMVKSSFFHYFDMPEYHPIPGPITELPEILLNVGYFLERGSLVSSIRVCRLWQQVFEPRLYRTVGCKPPLPSAEALQRHLSNIYILSLEKNNADMGVESQQLLYRCCNLRTLDLDLHERHPGNDCPELDMVKTNRMLRTLRIMDSRSLPSRSCWDQILSDSCPVLQELSLTNVRLGVDATGHLLRIAQSLSVLKLIRCHIAPLDAKATPKFTNMKELSIAAVFDSPLQELEWIGHCPRLQTLYWSKEWQESPGNFFQEIRLLRWPQLTDMSLDTGRGQFRDIEVAALLDACGHLRIVRANGSAFWYRSLKSLERHLDTLDELDLSDCTDVRSWMCQWILTQSPKLRSFYCEYIEAHQLIANCPEANNDIFSQYKHDKEADKKYLEMEERETLAGPGYQETREELRWIIAEFEATRISVHTQPWVCVGLEEFLCCIIHHAENRKEWDSHILGRLSSLKKLKCLDLGVYPHTSTDRQLQRVPSWHGLGFDLKSGLAQLETLTCLKDVLFYGTKQRLGEEDCQWMLDHWPSLKTISCDLHPDKDTCQKLKEMMESREVLTIE